MCTAKNPPKKASLSNIVQALCMTVHLPTWVKWRDASIITEQKLGKDLYKQNIYKLVLRSVFETKLFQYVSLFHCSKTLFKKLNEINTNFINGLGSQECSITIEYDMNVYKLV